MQITSKLFAYDNLFFNKQLCVPAGKLFQVSELSVVRSGEITTHIQECDELTYAVSGKAKIYSGTRCEEMLGGQVHYIKKACRTGSRPIQTKTSGTSASVLSRTKHMKAIARI